MQHRFIKNAKKTTYLAELIERYQEFRAKSPQKGQLSAHQATIRGTAMWESNDTIRSDWNFDTVKSTHVMGTFSSVAKDLLPEMDDEDMGDDEPSIYEEDEGSIDAGGAVNGSTPLDSGGIGMNVGAAHSTVFVKTPLDEPDISSLLAAADGLPYEPADSTEQTTPPRATHPANDGTPLGAPPAYTGSVRSRRRSSYAARQNMTGAGTVMREADLGSGVDTIRPVKKVDTIGSLRLSAEYVGTTRSREGSPSSPTSPSRDRSSFKRKVSESEQAGRAMIDGVVLPVLQNVSDLQIRHLI